MREDNENKPRFVTWKRVVALVLVIAMLVTSGLSAFIQVSISSDGFEDLAKNYLMQETPYINDSAPDRLMEKFKSLKRAQNLDSYYSQACVQIAEEKYDQALESLDKCLTFVKRADGVELYEDILIKKGCLLEVLDRKAEAITVLEESLNVNEHSSKRIDVYALLAQLYFMDQDYRNAANYYQKIADNAESDKSIAGYLYMYGTAEIQMEHYAEAEEILSRAIAADDSQEAIYYYRGISRLFQSKYEEAVEDLTESIERKSMIQSACYSRAVCRLSVDPNEYELPKEDLQMAIKYVGPDTDKDIVRQSKELLKALENASRKDVEYESESESEK